MGGFLYNNQAMLTGGILVGSAGTILTILMCRQWNRSLLNVIVGVLEGEAGKYNRGWMSGDFITIGRCRTVKLFQESSNCSRLWSRLAQASTLCHELDKLL